MSGSPGTMAFRTFTVAASGGSFSRRTIDEDCWVAISGYGPTKATVVDGGELFGKSR